MKMWHHGLFIVVSLGMAGFLLGGPKTTGPPLPSDETHQIRWDFTKCTSCHNQGFIPDSHLQKDGQDVRGGFVRCYICHRTGG